MRLLTKTGSKTTNINAKKRNFIAPVNDILTRRNQQK